MMDPKREKKPHQSKFVKQLCYYTIVFILQIRRVKISIFNWKIISISLTAVTLVNTGGGVTMVNTVGRTYTFTPSHVFITLGVGWAAFGLALILNVLYYVLHPSQVS